MGYLSYIKCREGTPLRNLPSVRMRTLLLGRAPGVPPPLPGCPPEGFRELKIQGEQEMNRTGYFSFITPAWTHHSYSWAHRSLLNCTSWQKYSRRALRIACWSG